MLHHISDGVIPDVMVQKKRICAEGKGFSRSQREENEISSMKFLHIHPFYCVAIMISILHAGGIKRNQ